MTFVLNNRENAVVWGRKHVDQTLMMEAASTSETSVDNYFTQQYIPEDKSELQNITLLLPMVH
jgi:hypothetical protein